MESSKFYKEVFIAKKFHQIIEDFVLGIKFYTCLIQKVYLRYFH